MDGSYQSLEALPIEHLQIVFVASSSCSEDDTSATTVSAPMCQQRPAAKKKVANGFADPAPPKVHDVNTWGKKSPRKMAAAKRVTSKDRGRGKRAQIEKKAGVEEEVLDAPPEGFPLRRVISIEEDHLPHLLQGGPQPLLHQLSEEEDEVDEEAEEEAQSDVETSVVIATAPTSSHAPVSVSREVPSTRKSRFHLSPRGQPVGRETQQVRPALWICTFSDENQTVF